MTRRLRALACAAILTATAAAVGAQQQEVYKIWLSPMPLTAVTVATMKGSGTVTATLVGNTLTISGKFEGLVSPATIAQIRRAPRGLRGPNLFDVTVTQAPAGTIEGKLTLTPLQIDELRKGWYYLQIHTEKNPDGQLRGWLLK